MILYDDKISIDYSSEMMSVLLHLGQFVGTDTPIDSLNGMLGLLADRNGEPCLCACDGNILAWNTFPNYSQLPLSVRFCFAYNTLSVNPDKKCISIDIDRNYVYPNARKDFIKFKKDRILKIKNKELFLDFLQKQITHDHITGSTSTTVFSGDKCCCERDNNGSVYINADIIGMDVPEYYFALHGSVYLDTKCLAKILDGIHTETINLYLSGADQPVFFKEEHMHYALVQSAAPYKRGL